MPLPTPLLIPVPFGRDATNINVIPATTSGATGLASWAKGWQPINEQPIPTGGIAPKCEDFNGLANALSQSIAAWQAGQGLPYESAIATGISGYGVGAVVTRADGTGFWVNTLSGNVSNPDSGGAGWLPAFNYGLQQFSLTNLNITLTAAQAAKSIIVLQGTLTGNVQITFPAQIQQWLVINATTGAFVVTATTSGGTPITLQQGGGNSYSVPVWCDGTNLYLTNIGPQTGSFTVTYVGGTTAPTGTVNWTRAGNQVTLMLPGGVTATSNSTSFYYTGIPAALLPPSWATLLQEFPLAIATDNGVKVPGAYAYLTQVTGTPVIKFALLGSDTGWTAGGVKSALGSFTYNLGL